MNIIKGICGSKGYCLGNAIVKTSTMPHPVKGLVLDYADEIAKFRRAQNLYYARLEALAEIASSTIGSESAGIFRAYQGIAKDEVFFKNAFARIERDSIGIEFAVSEECKKIVSMFDSMDDDYMRERAVDIKNVCSELIHIMMGVDSDFTHKTEGKTDVILVAENLTPAEAVKIDKSLLRGIVTELGGATSHTVFLAKALGIPAIVGAKGATKAIRDGDFITVNGFLGEIEVNPGDERRKAFHKVMRKYNAKRKIYQAAEKKPAVTLDGVAVSVGINAGDYESIRSFDASRCDGISFFRTESLYINAKTYPSEEEQLKHYAEAVRRAKGKEVVFRTLDMLSGSRASNLPTEENPAIGLRAIRLSLKRKDLFGEQLRALLRASASGDVKIMFPMIVTLEELLEAKACLERENQVLRDAGHAFNENIPVGVMVETPAAVLISDILARECDFFCIGANDLVQYVTAADRMNRDVEDLYDYCNIAVLRAVRLVAQNALKCGIKWSICGEAAADETLVPLWVAMGAGGLSVPPPQVGAIKSLIGNMNRGKIQKELEDAYQSNRIKDIRAHMARIFETLDLIAD